MAKTQPKAGQYGPGTGLFCKEAPGVLLNQVSGTILLLAAPFPTIKTRHWRYVHLFFLSPNFFPCLSALLEQKERTQLSFSAVATKAAAAAACSSKNCLLSLSFSLLFFCCCYIFLLNFCVVTEFLHQPSTQNARGEIRDLNAGVQSTKIERSTPKVKHRKLVGIQCLRHSFGCVQMSRAFSNYHSCVCTLAHHHHYHSPSTAFV